MNILVTNPIDLVGQRVIRELLAPEFSVRVIAPELDPLPYDIASSVDVVQGSLTEIATWQKALADIEAVLWLDPPTTDEVAPDPKQMLQAAAQANRIHRVSRMVVVSRDGSAEWQNYFESEVRSAGTAVRRIRCAILMEDFAWQAQSVAEHGILVGTLEPTAGVPITAAEDLVDAALRWLVRRSGDGFSTEILATEALCHDRIADILEDVLERPVRYEQLAPEDFIQKLIQSGVDGATAARISAQFIESSGITSTQNLGELARRTRFREWAASHFSALRTQTNVNDPSCCCTI